MSNAGEHPQSNIYRNLYRTSQNDETAERRVLVVDDDNSVLYIISKILSRHQYQVSAAPSAEIALEMVVKQNFDLIISDIAMPGMNGLEFLEALKRLDPLITSIVITGSGTALMALRAMRSGAQGFIPKPFTETELIEAIQVAVREAQMVRENMAMKLYMPLLEKTNAALLNAMEAKDQDSQGHSERVANLVMQIVQQLGLSDEMQTQIYFGALFHDIGKIGISDAILKKSGPLTPEESQEMSRHPEIGAHIIETSRGMEEAARIIRHHHERYDGTGHPKGLRGEEIPLGARMVAVVDTYEEMVRQRIYAQNVSSSDAINELIKGKGQQFDPELVDRFVEIIKQNDLKNDPPANRAK
jgi:putative two-component system response regulator